MYWFMSLNPDFPRLNVAKLKSFSKSKKKMA